MPDTKTQWAGVQPVSKTADLDNLRDRETSLLAEIDRLKKMNPGKAQDGGHDLTAVIQREEKNLIDIRKAIMEATK